MRYLIIFIVAIFTYPSHTFADNYNTKIYSYDTTHIIYEFTATKDDNKWKNTWALMRGDAKKYCSEYNKNYYFFSKKTNKEIFDYTYKSNMFSVTYRARFICAKNIQEAEKLVNRVIKDFKSPLYNQRNIKISAHNDPVLLDRIKVLDNHKEITKDEIIKKYFKGKKLESIEGIWLRQKNNLTKENTDDGTIIYIYKDSKNKFISRYYKVNYAKKGQVESRIEKISSKYFIAESYHPKNGSHFANTEYFFSKEGFFYETVKFKNGSTSDYKLFKMYPEKNISDVPNIDNAEKDNKLIKIASGTGFFINNKGHIVSNNHVVGVCKKITVNYQNQEIDANLIASDKLNDLGVIQISNYTTSNYIFIKEGGAELGEEITTFGFPLANALSPNVKVTRGIVSSLSGMQNNTSFIQIDAPIQPGNSGGPVLNDNGELVGVSQGALNKVFFLKYYKNIPENVNFAVSVPILSQFLKSNNIIVPGSSFFKKKYDTKSLAKLGSLATTQIFCYNTYSGYLKIKEDEKYQNSLFEINK